MDQRMFDFPDTPTTPDAKLQERDLTLSIIVAGLQRVISGKHNHLEQERIIRNAAMLLKEMVE